MLPKMSHLGQPHDKLHLEHLHLEHLSCSCATVCGPLVWPRSSGPLVWPLVWPSRLVRLVHAPTCYFEAMRVPTWWVIDPRSAPFAAYWDLFTSLLLVYVALVTPIEVGFIPAPEPSKRWSNWLFIINRVLDCGFILDMLLQFRLAYKVDDLEGTRWIVAADKVIMHYATSKWFALDLFSVLTSVFDFIGGDASDLTALRALRALRLLKLVKLARGSRVFKRWEVTPHSHAQPHSTP
jgi:hypothetical protein